MAGIERYRNLIGRIGRAMNRLTGAALLAIQHLSPRRRQAKIVSFDVFDTAITRLVLLPNHIHWLVARRAGLNERLGIDEETWRRHRIGGEASARQKQPGGEATLENIYAELDRTLGWTPELSAEVRAHEKACELAMLRPIVATRRRFDELRHAQRATIFISDTYFSRPDVATFLGHCGYDHATSEVFSSSEHRCSKAQGALYAVAAASNGVVPTQLHHIGDNYDGDVLKARLAGAAAEYFRLSHSTFYERLLYEHGGEDYLGSVIAGAARATRLSRDDAEVAEIGKAIGSACVGGPVLTAFVLWTLCEAEDRGIRRLYFLARDGQILQRLATKIANWAGMDVESHYLLASRQAFFLSSLGQDPERIIAEVVAGSHKKSVAEVLTELELESACVGDLLPRFGLTGSTQLDSPTSLGELASVLRNQDVLHRLLATIRERSKGLIEYLRRARFFEDGAVGIVDLGWNGNLQLRLERSISGCATHMPIGFYYDLIVPPPALAGRVFMFAHGTKWHPQLLESLCMADHGSVRGFRVSDDCTVEPLLGAPDEDGAISWGVRQQQDVILSYAETLLGAMDPRAISPRQLLSHLRSAAPAVLRWFIDAPGRAEAEAYGRIMHAPGQVHHQHIQIAPKASGLNLLRLIISKPYRSGRTFWIQGVIARSSDHGLGMLIWLAMQWRARRKASRRKFPPG